MTQELEVRLADGEVVKYEDLLSEFDGYDEGTANVQDAIPTINIVQGASSFEGAGKHGGEFWLRDRQEYVPALDCIVLFKEDTRALFHEGENEPLCAADDNYYIGAAPDDPMHPRPGMPLWDKKHDRYPGETITLNNGREVPTPSGNVLSCAQCPLSQREEGQAAPCSFRYRLMVLRIDDNQPAYLNMNAGSMGATRNYIQKMKAQKRPLASARVTLITQETTTRAGNKSYELRFTEVEDLAVETARDLMVMASEMRNRFKTARSEAPALVESKAKEDDGEDWAED